MTSVQSKTMPLPQLSQYNETGMAVSKIELKSVFTYFKNCTLFRWADANNDCEDRANAICMLLDAWQIPNGKGWVFSGRLLKKGSGILRNFWQYHVAAMLPVQEGNTRDYYVIDPSISDEAELIGNWAEHVTEIPQSYYVVRPGIEYIFHAGKIKNDNWHERDEQNFKWTIQGLAGINGLSAVGKAYITFNKKKIEKTSVSFNKLKAQKPDFTHG